MKAHIEKIHTGFGEPFQNDTGKYVYAQERITDSLPESISPDQNYLIARIIKEARERI